jgi:lipid A ethanolaminephosphotransferase
MKPISQYKLILFVAIFFVLFDNIAFFSNSIDIYGFSGMNIVYLSSLAVVLISFIILFFSLLSSKYTTKPLLILSVFVSSFTSYFMNNYNIVIDSEMIRNTMQTNFSEASDLLTFKLILYVIFTGVLPSFLIYKIKINYKETFLKESVAKLKTIAIAFLVVIITIISFSKFYTSFFRENKPLRFYTNPTYWIYSSGKYIKETYFKASTEIQKIADDAKIVNGEKPKLVIMVVGEALRANKFSLNGYEKETNPLLKEENIINFSNFYSCGTSTADSVPCMFSIYNRSDFNYQKGRYTENAVDVINKTGDVEVLWRDNNSDSKGVALRVAYQDYKSSNLNTVCDEECRDEGMLVGLDEFIKNTKKKNVLIVLHQMGNHGPAYYKRYPKEFEKFTPVCKTNQFEKCTVEEINNAYDNTALYTDYFLSKTINFLKKYDSTHEAAMVYMSDHGESLGENGIYLHGLPYFMAPDNQKHIASLMWFNENSLKNYNKEILLKNKDNEYSHDNLFHTLLGLFNIQTKAYNENLDILKDVR